MKIDKIEIFNIASLKGKHEINFNKVYEASGLFAITGKTGSGKSTLLNCISLALYGQNYKKGAQSNDFVTLGESEGNIQLFFTQEGKHFCAHWSLKLRKKNGELLKKPQLKRVLFQIIDDQKLAQEILPEDVLSLNFQEFCKTTILNQGEFARFLTSSFTERKDILEKFYQGENLEQLNINLREQIKELDQQLLVQTQTIEGLSSEEDQLIKSKEHLENDRIFIQKFTKNKDSLESVAKNVEELYKTNKNESTNKNRLIALETQLGQTTKDHNSNTALLNSSSEALSQIQESLKEKRPLLRKCIESLKINNEKQKRIERNNLQIESMRNEDTHNKEKLEINIKAKSTNAQQMTEYEKILSKTQSNRADFTSDYNHLIELKHQLINAKDKITSIRRENEETNIIIESYSQELKTLKEQALKHDLSKTQDELATTRDLLKISDELLYALENFKEQKLSFDNEHKQQLVLLTNFKDKKEKLDEKMTEDRERFDLLTDSLNYHKLLQAHNLCLEQSIKDDKCLICGNTEVQNIQSTDESPDFKRYKENLDKQKTLELVIQTQIKELEAITVKIEFTNQKILSLEENSLELDKKMKIRLESNQLSLIYSLKKSPTIEQEITSIKNDLNEKITSFEKLIEKQQIGKERELNLLKLNSEALEKMKRLSKDLINLTTTEKNHSLSLEEYKTKYHGLKLTSLNNFIEQIKELSDTQIKKNKLDVEIQSLDKSIEFLNQSFSKNSTSIKALQKENDLHLKQIEEAQIFIKTNSNLKSGPEQELLHLEEEEEKKRSKFNEHQESDKELRVKVAELNSRINSSKDQLTELSLLKEESILKLQSAKLLSLETQTSANKEEIDHIYHNSSRIIEKFNMCVNQKLLTEEYLELLKEQSLTLYSDSKALLKNLEHRYTEEFTLKKAQDEKEEKIKKIKETAESKLNELTKLKDLHLLIGKDEFRNYVLSMIESALIEQTNKELKSICQGRYVLTQTHKTNRMASEFKIVDYYRDGFERKISTLSGGETFLVSLAMALALAELTRGKVKIDSLFIDEGFGTLDENSIEEIFELLQQIQNTGKQIGVISHIKALTSRIPLNINLDKNSQGLSTINLIYN